MAVKLELELTRKALVAHNDVSLARWFCHEERLSVSIRTRLSNQGVLEYMLGLQKLDEGAPKGRKGQLLTDAQLITSRSERTIFRYLTLAGQDLETHITENRPIQHDATQTDPHFTAIYL